jgi:rubrerythrin
VTNISDKQALAHTEALLDFALAEFCSGIEMLQAAKRTDDYKLAAGFMRHAMDEYRHAHLFYKISKSVAERYGLKSLNPYLPSHSYKKRYLDSSSFIFEKKSPDRFSVFVTISEKYAANHFASIIEKNTFVNTKEKKILKDILKDEKRHILFAEQAVKKFKTYKPIKHLLYTVLEKKDLFQRNIKQRFEKLNSIIAGALLRVSTAVLGLLVQSIEKKLSQDKNYPDLDSAISQSNDMY